jgi:hypothetical protein
MMGGWIMRSPHWEECVGRRTPEFSTLSKPNTLSRFVKNPFFEPVD